MNNVTLFFSAWLLFLSPCGVFAQTSMIDDDILSVYASAWGDELVLTKKGLYQADGRNLRKIEFQHGEVDNIDAFTVDGNTLWLSHNNQISKVNLITLAFSTELPLRASKFIATSQGLFFITADGLYRYHKHVLTEIYKNTTAHPISDFVLANNLFAWLVLDNAITKVTLDSKQALSVLRNHHTTDLFYSAKGQLWFINQLGQLAFLKNQQAHTFQPLKEYQIKNFTITKSGLIYFLSGSTLYHFNLYNNENTLIKPLKSAISAFKVNNKQQLWLKDKASQSWFKYQPNLITQNHQNHWITSLLDYEKLGQIKQILPLKNTDFLVVSSSGLWRVNKSDPAPTHLTGLPQIHKVYLQTQALLWLFDNDFAYQYNLETKMLSNRFPIKMARGMADLTSSQPLIFTPSHIYKVTPTSSVSYLQPSLAMGEINDVFVVNQQIWLATTTGLWLAKKEKQWQFTQHAYANITSLFALDQTHFWLITNQQALVFNHHKQQITAYHDEKIAHTETVFQSKKHLQRLSSNRLSTLQFNPNAETTHLEGLRVSYISVNQQSAGQAYFGPSLNNLPKSARHLRLRFVDQTIANNDFKLQYRLSKNGAWYSLPKGQSLLSLSTLNDQFEYLEVKNSASFTDQSLIIKPNLKSFNYITHFSVFIVLVCLLVIALLILSKRHRLTSRPVGLVETLLNQTQEAVWIADEQFKILHANQKFTDITGFLETEVKNKVLHIYNHQVRNRKLEQLIITNLLEHGYWSGEIWSTRKNGEEFSMSLAITRIHQQQWYHFASRAHYVATLNDITVRKQQEKQLRQLATRDSITGLLNRTVFIEQMQLAIQSSDNQYPEFCILFIDLDNFHKVNDGLGHSQGDQLLQIITQRIKQVINPGYNLACLGGDEFGILIPPHLFDKIDVFSLKKLCDTILNSIRRRIQLLDIELSITASIGSAQYPDNGFNCESLMRSADSALKHAKQKGKNGYQFFNKSVQVTNPETLSIESAIYRSIEQNDFILHYQPKLDMNHNTVKGVEALVRWPDRNGQLRPPSEFIEIAEKNNAIVPLTRNLINIACQQIKKWQQQGVNINGAVAINLSAIHFQRKELLEDLSFYLNKYQISGRLLELEITESVMMDDPEFALKQMHKLKRLGFTIALDDFGTGHSSLSYLKRFPIDRLKIDRSFIIDIENSEQDRNITSTIIRLAKYLNIEVIAEGVETQEQAYLLHVMGCEQIQGYFFSKPIAPNEVSELVKQLHQATH